MPPILENEPSKETNVKFDDLDVEAALKKEGMNFYEFSKSKCFEVSICFPIIATFFLREPLLKSSSAQAKKRGNGRKKRYLLGKN